jgi:hypothetical protein
MLSTILDVALGLVLLYTILSVLTSAINELISGLMNWRSKHLVSFIGSILKDSGYTVDQFFENTLIVPQTADGNKQKPPAYVKASDFSLAVLDLLSSTTSVSAQNITTAQAQAAAEPAAGKKLDADNWRALAAKLPPGSPLKKVMMTTLSQAEDDVEKARVLLENWYDSSMERVSGWYKGRTQLWLLLISALIVGVMNIDTITVANRLLKNPALREGLAAQAALSAEELQIRQELAQTQPAETSDPAEYTSVSATTVSSAYYTLDALNLPIGWSFPIPGLTEPGDFLYFLVRKLIGLAVTVFAVSQGAPFWFDMLNKLTNLRYNGRPPELTGRAADTPTPTTETRLIVETRPPTINPNEGDG